MSDNKRKKLASKKAKAEAKKAKLKAKKAKLGVIVALLAFVCGCSTSEPASRITRAEYGDIIIRLYNSRSNTVSLTIGDGAYTSADSDGSTETMTANPTNTTDVKPNTDVNVGGAKNGTSGMLGEAAGKLLGSDEHTGK